MSQLPTEQENPNGFHQKYIISRANGKPIDPNAVYLVLRLDGSELHAQASRCAAERYAEAILAKGESDLTQTAKDILELVDKLRS